MVQTQSQLENITSACVDPHRYYSYRFHLKADPPNYKHNVLSLMYNLRSLETFEFHKGSERDIGQITRCYVTNTRERNYENGLGTVE